MDSRKNTDQRLSFEYGDFSFRVEKSILNEMALCVISEFKSPAFSWHDPNKSSVNKTFRQRWARSVSLRITNIKCVGHFHFELNYNEITLCSIRLCHELSRAAIEHNSFWINLWHLKNMEPLGICPAKYSHPEIPIVVPFSLFYRLFFVFVFFICKINRFAWNFKVELRRSRRRISTLFINRWMLRI